MNFSKIPNIIKGIRKYYPVSDESLKELTGYFVDNSFAKNHLLTRAGVKDNFVYFIEKGCLRTYLLIEGKEVTNWFSQEGEITFSSNALYHQTPGFDYVEVLEDAQIFTIPIKKLNELYETNIEITNWARVIHQEVLLKMQTLRIDRLSLSAKERYDKFLLENPGLINRVNLGYVASYLGVTQQYLSNLRANQRF